MSYRDPRVMEWEARLQSLFDEIDHVVEAEFGHIASIHPARPARGETSSPSADGLFDLGAAFTAGYGSKHGGGYVVTIRVATLSHIAPDVIEAIERRVLNLLEQKLPDAFPNRHLRVEREDHAYKIIGDLSIG
jgi:hypothetical protein